MLHLWWNLVSGIMFFFVVFHTRILLILIIGWVNKVSAIAWKLKVGWKLKCSAVACSYLKWTQHVLSLLFMSLLFLLSVSELSFHSPYQSFFILFLNIQILKSKVDFSSIHITSNKLRRLFFFLFLETILTKINELSFFLFLETIKNLLDAFFLILAKDCLCFLSFFLG